MTRVFIVNEPLSKDTSTGEYGRFLDLNSAAAFGDVIELTPKGNPGSNLAPAMASIRSKLEELWEDGDFVVLVGDQALLAYAASVIGEWIGEVAARTDARVVPVLRFLRWDRRRSAYTPLVMREPETAITGER